MSEMLFPDQTYGELREGLHIAGYTLERAFQRLEALLSGDGWSKVGPGFRDVNVFLDTLRLDKFRALTSERQAITKRIKELQPSASNAQIARTLGVSDQTINNDAKKLAHSGGEGSQNREHVAKDLALSGAEAAAVVRKREDRFTANERREERLEEIAKANRDLPTGVRYPIVYADPPWRYENPPIGASNRSIENHYPTMTLEEICALKVGELAADDAILYLWATAPKLAECIKVIEAWGFVYRTNLVWIKDKIGMGYHARNQHELLLIAKRGSVPPPAPEDRGSSVVYADRGDHSEKPAIFYELIERWYPGLPKIELFSRAPRAGWDAWGNQAEAAE